MVTVDRQYGGRSVTERRAERTQRFVQVATRLFAEKGYAQCSLADVCAAAGLSKRQFYEAFATREDVLIAAYDRIQDDAAAAVTGALEALAADSDPHQRVTTMFCAYLDSLTGDPHRAKVALLESVNVSARVEEHRRQRRAVWAQLLTTAVAPTVGQGTRLRGRSEFAAAALIGAVNATVEEWLLSDPRPPVTALLEILVPSALVLIEGR